MVDWLGCEQEFQRVARKGVGFVVWPGIGEVVVRGGGENVRVLCEPVIEEV